MIGIDEIEKDLRTMDDWSDRFRYVIRLGRTLPEYPEYERVFENQIWGCSGQVWVCASVEDGRMFFFGDSDAAIVKGLVAIVIAFFDGKTPEEVLADVPEELFCKMGLSERISKHRSNGLLSVIGRIKELAVSLCT